MTPPEWNNYAPEPAPHSEPARPTGRRGLAKPLLGAAVAVALFGWGGISLGKAVFGNEEPQTVEGFAQLLEDIEDKSGSTEVFEAVLYPSYARVDLPVAPKDEREVSYRWDGNFSMEIKGTNDQALFDLADIDASLFAGICEQVSALVDDPDDCYLIISRPDDTSSDRTGAWISAHVSNDYRQSASISYDREGKEVSRYSSTDD